MGKPKVVCVTGSALLAGLTFLLVPIVICLVLMYFGWLPRFPNWIRYPCLIGCVIGVPWVSAPIYRWYFGHCYRPPFAVRGIYRG